MDTTWGRPSPLDELRSHSGYFPDLSSHDDTQSIFTYQEETDPKSNMATNQSVLSFETVRTNERLLDKLDLSVEDEALLHQALVEEEENSRAFELRQQQRGPVICMPASKFPSLRMKGLVTARDMADNERMQSLKGLNLKGNTSTSAVEQHYAAKSRYSYLAEEDSDSEYGISSMGDLTLKENAESRESNPKVVNFENYRVENAAILSQFPLVFSSNGQLKKSQGSRPYTTSTESFEPAAEATVLGNNKMYQNGSGSSTKTSFVEAGQLSKPKTQSSLESDSSLTSYSRSKDRQHDVPYSTPTKSSSSPSVNAVFFKDTPKEPYRTHKKKPSFSFKNLFKSPKSVRSRNSLDTKESYEESSIPLPSGESSPKKKSQQFRKFIFPASPILPFEPQTPQSSSKPTKRKAHHFRSLSDFHKVSPSAPQSDVHLADEHDTNIGSSLARDKPRRKLSLDSRRPAIPVSSFNTPPHSRQQSQNHLHFYNEKVDRKSETPQDSIKLSPDHQIKTAIRMRNVGQLEESAKRLRKACLANDKTAFLLYGLALRHGCGVPKDYKDSFRYIKAATGVLSEVEDVLNCEIDPFELELKDSMPKVVPEPTAPALYECGIAYLKGYGPDQRNETFGLKYVEKAASLGHIDSMCLSATIWSKKSETRKKDVARAAAWFRLAEKRGANLIGSQWIHKDKYMKRA